MSYILQVDFPYTGPWGNEMTAAMEELARSINAEPGFVWKFWTANESTAEAGGVYLFEDKASAETYLAMHTARLSDFGISPVNGKIFEVHQDLSKINRAPI